MKKILLDSSVVVDFIRVNNKASTIFQKLLNLGYQLCISVMTHTELYSGKSVWESPVARKELEFILSGLQIFKLDEKVSKKAGNLKATYHIEIADAIIAATAIAYKLELATLNTKDFAKIKGLKLASV